MNKTTHYPEFNPRKCTACWKCIEACPRNAIRKVGFLWHKHAKPLHRHCIGCNLCVKTCPQGCFRHHFLNANEGIVKNETE